MTREQRERDALAALERMLTEFRAVDLEDGELDQDLRNLVSQSIGIMEGLSSDWELATSDEHRYLLQDDIGALHTLLRAMPLFANGLDTQSESTRTVLHMAVRCNPLVKSMCPEYAEFRDGLAVP